MRQLDFIDLIDLVFDPYVESAIWGALARRAVLKGDAPLARAWAENAATIARLIQSRKPIPQSLFGAWRGALSL